MIRFYNRDSFASQGLLAQLGYHLVALWSHPFIHVDVESAGLVLSANLSSGRAMLHPVATWDGAALSIALPWPDHRVLRHLQAWHRRHLRYGLLDLLLIPLRRWARFDGRGVICSELVGELLVGLVQPGDEAPWRTVVQRIEQVGAHTLTPQQLYDLLPCGLSVCSLRMRPRSGHGHGAAAGPL